MEERSVCLTTIPFQLPTFQRLHEPSMDINTEAEDVSYGENTFSESFALSYADDTTYEEQVAAIPSHPRIAADALAGLKSRISKHKVYLPPENMMKGKVRDSWG
jgi:hypothetical protein